MDLNDLLGTGPGTAPRETDELICSRKGCTRPAEFALAWNNPKIHVPERRKVWLACPEHREYLADFLGARGFLKDVRELPSPGPQTDPPQNAR